MKKQILFNTILFAFLCFAGIANLKAQNQVAYRIDFTNELVSDASVAKSTANFIADLVTGGEEYLSACTQTNNTYAGIGGIKLSSSGTRGKFTLTLSALGQVNATKIVVQAAQWGTDVEQIAVNGTQTGNLTATPTEYEFPLDGSLLTSITVESKLKRCYIYYIDVYVASSSSTPVCATPTISPEAGFYTSPQNITLSCDTADATIRYTLDGTNPTSTSTLYTDPFQLDTAATVKARAWKAGMDSSAVATAIYTFPVEEPVLEASPSTLLVFDNAASNFTVTAAYLTNTIDITSTNPDFQVNPASLPASTTSSSVSVTFTGTANTTGQIILTSGTLSDTVNVTGEIYVEPIDAIIYTTGFEAAEGFAAGTTYNNATIAYTGNNGEQWGTIYGTPATTGAIAGAQSMQMRWYTSAASTLGSTETNFDLHNVTKVTFKAKNTVVGAGLNVTATYSTDGGNAWTGDSTYALTANEDDFTYFITDSGQHYNVRVKFQVALQESNPTNTVRLYIDDVKVYGIPGSEPAVVATPIISPNTGNYSTPQSVSITCETEDAEIRYTLDGSDPEISSELYTDPFLVDATTTVKARGFKIDYDASNIATATYTFPVEVPVLEASPSTLLVFDNAASNFTVTAAYLTSTIDITSTNPDFQVNPTSLPASTTSGSVSVTFTGTTNTTGQIILTSGTLSDTVNVTGEIYVEPNDAIIYTTGFEADEGFVASTVYNNVTMAYTGNDNEQWGTIYGTPATTGAIAGAQSLQMRWYVNAPTTLGSTETNFDLHNVTKVTFKASNYNPLSVGTPLKVTATYSTDGGTTWTGDSTYTPPGGVAEFTYFITNSGEYYNVRLKFQVALQATNPTGTARLYIDDVNVYGIPGLEPTVVATPVISPNTGNYFTPQSVSITCETEDAEIRYTLDGSDPEISSELYTDPFLVDATTTVKARGFKIDYDASNIATATYTFPVEVPNIAAWKAANSANSNTPYTITGDVTFVFKNSSNIYVEDATGGLLIYDNTPIITETYAEGDVISGGITGKCQMYNGMREFIPLLNTAPATANSGTVAPTVVAAATLESNADEYESRLVRINQITFEAGAFNTTNATSINFTQDETALIARNSFKTLDMTIEEGTTADIIGFAAIYNGGVQLYPRNNDDIIMMLDTVALPYFRGNEDGICENGDTIFIFVIPEFDIVAEIEILCDTDDATIYYTTDGSEPTTASTLYTEPVDVIDIPSHILRAIAVKEGMINSAVSTVYITFYTGINTVNQDLVTLYPNPTQSFIQLNNLFEVQAQAIVLYNAQGLLIGKYAVSDNNIKISFSGMAAGTYFIQIATPKGNIVKKITKN